MFYNENDNSTLFQKIISLSSNLKIVKAKFIILLCLVSSLSVYSQGMKASSDSSSSSYRMNTIFGNKNGSCKIPLGYFVEFNAGYTRFGHRNVFLPGISAGLILDHHWTIGITGNFIGNPHGLHFSNIHSDSAHPQARSADMRGGYGGGLFEYTLFPQSVIHVSFPLIIGVGMMYLSPSRYGDNSGTLPPDYKHHYMAKSSFFVIEPGVKMEVNLSKIFRMGLGISYRYAPDPDLKRVSETFFNQFTARLSLRFGKL